MAKRTCFTCMTKYSFCPHCDEGRNKPNWMMLFHCENCRTIYDTLQRYSSKEYTLEEALKIIDKCDLSEKDTFNPSVLKDLDALLAARPKKVRTKKIVNKENEND